MMTVYLEASCSPSLRTIFAEGDGRYFRLSAEFPNCDVAIFQRDDRAYIRSSPVFVACPERCLAITEWDKPSFFLPTICASNTDAWYTRGRSETMHYPIVQRASWNSDISELATISSEKRYLYSFIGKSSGLARKRILRHFRNHHYPDVVVEDTGSTVTNHVVYQPERRRRYAEVMAASKFALCPRGWGTGSVRLFEACEMGVVPVILADGWPLIPGPDWGFAVFIPEHRVADIDKIIRHHASEWAERGAAARAAFQNYFAVDVAALRLSEAIDRMRPVMRGSRESTMRTVHPAVAFGHLTSERFRKAFVSYRP